MNKALSWFVAALFLAGGRTARATVSSWNPMDGLWSAGGNWTPAGSPLSGAGTNLAFESGTYTSTNDLAPTPFLLNALALNNSGPGTAILAGNALKLIGVGAQILQSSAGDFEINLPTEIGDMTLLAGNGTGSAILNGALTGFAGITKIGTSTFRLGSSSPSTTSDNTFHGGVRINNGAIRFHNDATSARTALRANHIIFGSKSAQLSATSELRCGELVGSVGSIFSRDTAAPFDGQNILLFPLGDGIFAGSLSTVATASTSNVSGTLTIRGVCSQTLSGKVSVDNAIIVGEGSELRLSGTASLKANTNATLNINGGRFVLDNTALDNGDRLRDLGSDLTGLDVIGGGFFSLIGNHAGTRETMGRLQLGSGEPRSGALTINVTHAAGSSAPTVLTFGSYSRQSAASTVDFTANNAHGKVLPLGIGGSNPRIMFSVKPPLHNDLLSPSNSLPEPTSTGPNDHIGWATVNGSAFATYVNDGIAAVTTTPFPSASKGTHNALLAGSSVITGPLQFSLNSLKIAPSGSFQQLRVLGKGALNTNAILLAGSRDFAIVNAGSGTGILDGRGGSRYLFVQKAMLTLGLNLGTLYPLTVSGHGTVALTNSANVSLTKALTINSGTVRATPGTSLPGGPIELRGGVLEIAGGGTYSPMLGSGFGNINWFGATLLAGVITPSQKDEGSGGFAAFGADATVTVMGPLGASLTWEEPYFLDSNHSLVFGSTRADSTLTFTDDIILHGGSGGKSNNYSPRQIRVIDNPNNTHDFARLSGKISGPSFADLLKSGDGVLELTGDNGGILGGVIVTAGSLLSNNDKGFGPAFGAYLLLGARSGTAATSLLTSSTSGTVTIARDIHVVSGSLGKAVIGNTTAPNAASASNAVFSGNIGLGLSGSLTSRLLELHAEAGTVVQFNGDIRQVSGYLGTITLTTTGTGTILLSGANNYFGPTIISAGIMEAAAPSTIPATSQLSVQLGATFSLESFNQTVGSISGAGTINLGTALLTTGADNTSSSFVGTITGAGRLTKIGTGGLNLSGANTYSGLTEINAGILEVSNTIGSATGSGGVEVHSNAVISGNGAVIGPVTILGGGTISPGKSVGILTTGAAQYASAGMYRWQLKDAVGFQGLGHDLHQINGTLNISASAALPFIIDVVGLTSNSMAGPVIHFTPRSDYSWTIVSATGGITGFAPEKLQISTAEFMDGTGMGGGTFSIVQRGNTLVLLFTGTPVRGAGVYNALILNESPTHENSGYIRIATTVSGFFTGTLKYAGYSYSFRGGFDAGGGFTHTIVPTGRSSLTIQMHLDLASNQITGTVTQDQFAANPSTFTGRRELYHDRTSPAPEAGRYTVLLPPDPAASGAGFPQGNGFARMAVKPSGTILLVGKLADGTPFSLGALLDSDGSFPFYVGLYPRPNAPRGSIRGSIQFQDLSNISDLDGTALWDKPPQTMAVFYKDGFATTTHIIGSLYVPHPASRPLDFSLGKVQFGRGDLNSVVLSTNVALSSTNKISITDFPNSSRLSLIISIPTGLFYGSFLEPSTTKMRSFGGVLFQKQNLGSGLFLGVDQSGFVNLGPP